MTSTIDENGKNDPVKQNGEQKSEAKSYMHMITKSDRNDTN